MVILKKLAYKIPENLTIGYYASSSTSEDLRHFSGSEALRHGNGHCLLQNGGREAKLELQFCFVLSCWAAIPRQSHHILHKALLPPRIFQFSFSNLERRSQHS